MNFNDVINKRRSIRKYQEKEVTKDQLLEIIKYGTLSPSAKNRQPWKVTIATKEEKNTISDLLNTKKDFDITIQNTSDIIRQTNQLILIFQDTKEQKQEKNDILSIGAFIMSMLLKATEMDLGSLWIANTDYINQEIKELYKTSLNCISVVAIGYKNQNPDKRPRKDLKDIFL